MALAADEAGFAGLALMDHLIQIPQVGSAWQPIPEPWVTLGLVAGLDTRLTLGTLCTPATFRPAGITAKAAATLDALTGGRAFLGIGAGWWEREHAAYGLPFPPARERLDFLETTIETCRALWAAGTKAYDGGRVSLPETTSYPRPAHEIPVIVGGSGEQRTLAIAARLGDACNLPSDPEVLARKLSCSTGTWPQPAAPATTSPSRCWTCRWSGATARTRGPRSSGSRATHARSGVREADERRHRGAAPGALHRPGRARGEHGVRRRSWPRSRPTTCSPSPASPGSALT